MRNDMSNSSNKIDHSEVSIDLSLRVMKAIMYRDADGFALAFADWLRIKRLRVSEDAREILMQTLGRT